MSGFLFTGKLRVVADGNGTLVSSDRYSCLLPTLQRWLRPLIEGDWGFAVIPYRPSFAVCLEQIGPDPLTVSVGGDQAVYVGQTATVTATADGGSEAYTYAWTRVSGPAGSFLNAGQASTVFTPSGGAGT